MTGNSPEGLRKRYDERGDEAWIFASPLSDGPKAWYLHVGVAGPQRRG